MDSLGATKNEWLHSPIFTYIYLHSRSLELQERGGKASRSRIRSKIGIETVGGRRPRGASRGAKSR